MNTELLGGVLVARLLEGMRFALGCTVAIRRNVLDAMGGFSYLQEFLAEDFVIGRRAAELGHEVVLSSSVIQHRIGSQGIMKNLSHRLRWARSTRRSRPAGYWGQLFTYPFHWLCFCGWFGRRRGRLCFDVAGSVRAAAAATASYILKDPLVRKQWWLLRCRMFWVSWSGWAGFWATRLYGVIANVPYFETAVCM